MLMFIWWKQLTCGTVSCATIGIFHWWAYMQFECVATSLPHFVAFMRIVDDHGHLHCRLCDSRTLRNTDHALSYTVHAAGDELPAIIMDLGHYCRKDHCKGKDCLGRSSMQRESFDETRGRMTIVTDGRMYCKENRSVCYCPILQTAPNLHQRGWPDVEYRGHDTPVPNFCRSQHVALREPVLEGETVRWEDLPGHWYSVA